MFNHTVMLLHITMVDCIFMTSHCILFLFSDDCGYKQFACISTMREKVRMESWIAEVQKGQTWWRKEDSGITSEPLWNCEMWKNVKLCQRKFTGLQMLKKIKSDSFSWSKNNFYQKTVNLIHFQIHTSP